MKQRYVKYIVNQLSKKITVHSGRYSISSFYLRNFVILRKFLESNNIHKSWLKFFKFQITSEHSHTLYVNCIWEVEQPLTRKYRDFLLKNCLLSFIHREIRFLNNLF